MLSLLLGLALAESPVEPDPEPEPELRGLLLQNARLIDGTGAEPRLTDIWVVEDRIHQIGPELEVGLAAEVLDLRGQSVVPGLIDGHVHATLAPGQYLFDWSEEELQEHLDHHMRAYVAAGVTSVLDCASLDPDRDLQLLLRTHRGVHARFQLLLARQLASDIRRLDGRFRTALKTGQALAEASMG